MDQEVLKDASEMIVSIAGIALTAGVSIGATWLRQHLKISNDANQSAADLNANTIIQNAVHNAAGAIVLDIASGKLDLTKPASIVAAASDAAKSVMVKVPDAIAKFGVSDEAVAQMIVGKVGHSVGVPPTPNTATEAKAEAAGLPTLSSVEKQIAAVLLPTPAAPEPPEAKVPEKEEPATI